MHRLALAAALALTALPAHTTVLVDQDFSAFAGAGLAPGGAGGALDSLLWTVSGASDGDSRPGERVIAGDLARGLSAGGVRAGGLYAFELPGGTRGLGLQATGPDFTPATLTRRVHNPGPDPLETLVLAFQLWFRNDAPRATAMTVEAGAGREPATWLPIPGLAATTPAAAGAGAWELVTLVAPLPLAELAPGGWLSLRWTFDDAAGTGGRDELALSALQVAGVAPGPPVTGLAEPASAALAALALWMAAAGRRGLLIGNAAATAS